MKVILDANVLIAAFASRGLCESVLELCLESHEIVLSDQILEDLEQKLVRKIKVPAAVATEICKFMRSQAVLVIPVPLAASICRDPDDLKELGLVPVSQAKVLITGDKDLLVIRRFASARMVTPRQFWEGSRKLLDIRIP